MLRSHHEDNAKRTRRYIDEGKSAATREGFTKLFPTPTDAGKYLAPNEHTEPNGLPLLFTCAPMVTRTECNLIYWLPGDITLQYWFMTSEVERSRWLELDQLMRRIVTRLVDKDYLLNWKDTTGGIQ
jgi:hypothetical protein